MSDGPKSSTYAAAGVDLEAGDRAVELMKASFTRPDFAEGVKSFLERRPPEFPRYTRA